MDKILQNFLGELLKCGYSDIEELEKVLAIADTLYVDYNLDDLRDARDFNTVLYEIMKQIFEDLISELSEEEQEKARDNFDPYLNYMDSWFNIEYLDETEPEEMTREKAIKGIRDWLKTINTHN